MTENERILAILETAFPVEPKPISFFLAKHNGSIEGDILHELRERIAGRPWTKVTLLDWKMIGTSPAIARRYLEPATFMYYVPSVLEGALQEIEYIEFALEGIIPDNKYHMPRGNWWFEFTATASPRQREAISAFLSHIRVVLWDRIGFANQYFLEHAENIWK